MKKILCNLLREEKKAFTWWEVGGRGSVGAVGVALSGSLGLQGTLCRVLYYVSNNRLPDSGECGYRPKRGHQRNYGPGGAVLSDVGRGCVQGYGSLTPEPSPKM